MKVFLKNIAFFVNRVCLNLKHNDVKCKSKARIYPKTVFGGNNIIGCNTSFRGSIGEYSYIGNRCNINADIGRFCSISNSVQTVSGTHPSKIFVSTHPAFYSTKKQCGKTFTSVSRFDEQRLFDKNRGISCKIGNDVWIGTNAILMGGITVGDGAIIAAGSVVTHDVLPYSIVGGVPAKEIKKRFTDEQIEVLISSKWWDNKESWFVDHIDMFCDIERFIGFIEEGN